MISLQEKVAEIQKLAEQLRIHRERREHRRHDLEGQQIIVERWDGERRGGRPVGTLMDLSAGGVRFRTQSKELRPDTQIRVRLSLPEYAGISPFIDTTDGVKPRREWVGWMTIARVNKIDNKSVDVAGRLNDMEEMDRGMLGLYLSTQPLAA